MYTFINIVQCLDQLITNVRNLCFYEKLSENSLQNYIGAKLIYWAHIVPYNLESFIIARGSMFHIVTLSRSHAVERLSSHSATGRDSMESNLLTAPDVTSVQFTEKFTQVNKSAFDLPINGLFVHQA